MRKMTEGTIGNAVLSADQNYRYCLLRRWDTNVQSDDTILWVMLNPSTADAMEDDATIAKITKFSKTWGYSALTVVNLFAWRSRDPTDLTRADDPVGPDNAKWIENWMTVSNMTIAAWGASFPTSMKVHVAKQALWLKDQGAYTMGLTKNGHPRHPLYLPDSTMNRRWE